MAVKLSLSLPHGPLPALKPQGSAGILMLSSFQAFHMYPHQLNGSNLYLFAMAAISLAMVKIRLEIGGCIGTGMGQPGGPELILARSLSERKLRINRAKDGKT
ncbi:hypothetical protein H112_06359 [Trichophyton rubrum D6]|uniref:Uncharacterized protein n=3 Tax=Trichophyton TaxID=5550 RepID=F2SHQ3_TRIRC|nr:uncharacterized protein TERG_01730 [Trichophyton rubrum CBS 118892]EZF13212.1 hypothetical protein H100_06374 [Trichophyton rubrum MR850]EZF39741.1 hypothetical protein H102_06340 [Trichophyton rubrum CBS 100081]EZF50266.1 hypothetical protein H103_06366 [Trichophyton rubrum CBS 288.86]EZF60897.1 hypothetical protein H104_06352 [Trichophyton rubrum CBS 289.86]EZF71414.1 hypothetical protein H105_06379 [Trichophyton soudanense CBS 452.61]EZF82224.1 hypothetical protein H110_06362 [Trichophy